MEGSDKENKEEKGRFCTLGRLYPIAVPAFENQRKLGRQAQKGIEVECPEDLHLFSLSKIRVRQDQTWCTSTGTAVVV